MRIEKTAIYDNKTKNINHKSGLSQNFAKYVTNVNSYEIKKKLIQDGIKADFAGCRVVAACVEKVVDIFKKYNLALPNVFKFEPIENQNWLGYFHPKSASNKEVVINANHGFFYDIYEQDKHCDKNGRFHCHHFLETYLHEFAHNAHYCNLIKNHGEEKGVEIWNMLGNMQMSGFWASLKTNYAKKDMLEYIAESVTKKIADNLDLNLYLEKTPTLGYKRRPPETYRTYSFSKYAHNEDTTTIYDRNIFQSVADTESAIWDGDLKYLFNNGAGIKNHFSYVELKSYENTLNEIKKFFSF